MPPRPPNMDEDTSAEDSVVAGKNLAAAAARGQGGRRRIHGQRFRRSEGK